jgi:hypothetical protein
MNYANKLKDSLVWWLGRSRPFIVNDEYSIELLFIDKINNSAKIKVTNLKTGQDTLQTISNDELSSGVYDVAE